MSVLAPIALFVYNRPEHARQTVEALKENTLARGSELIVFSDGAKSDRDTEGVRRTREYIHTIEGFRTVRIVERAVNMGLARSIIDGVTGVVNEYGRIIVLEDDLVTDLNFLEFMNDALEKYSQDERVMQVSGYMFPVSISTEQETFMLPLTTSWGWATWKRAWAHFDAEAQGYAELQQDRERIRAFDLDDTVPYFEMLKSQLSGKNDSWAILWWLSVFRRNGLVLYPRNSLIENIGFDGSGTHGKNQMLIKSLEKCSEKIELPDEIRQSDVAYTAVIDLMRANRPNRLRQWIRRILR